MNSVVGFCKFLCTGSLYPEIEKVLDDPNKSMCHSAISIDNFVTIEFKRNDFELKDLGQLQSVTEQDRETQATKTIDNKNRKIVVTIDDQVIAKAPNLEFYKGEYQKLKARLTVGAVVGGVLDIALLGLTSLLAKKSGLSSFWASRSVTSYLIIGSALSICMVTIGCIWRTTLAIAFEKGLGNVDDEGLNSYKAEIIRARNYYFSTKNSDVLGLEPTTWKTKSLSPSEIEIIGLFSIYQQLKEGKRRLKDILDTDYLKDKPLITDEFKAIKIYLKEVVSQEWVSEVVSAFIEALEPLKLGHFVHCKTNLNKILSHFSIDNLHNLLKNDDSKAVIDFLLTYLKARMDRNTSASLPNEKQLSALINPIRAQVLREIVKIINNFQISLGEISKDSSFFKKVDPQAWETAVAEKTVK